MMRLLSSMLFGAGLGEFNNNDEEKKRYFTGGMGKVVGKFKSTVRILLAVDAGCLTIHILYVHW